MIYCQKCNGILYEMSFFRIFFFSFVEGHKQTLVQIGSGHIQRKKKIVQDNNTLQPQVILILTAYFKITLCICTLKSKWYLLMLCFDDENKQIANIVHQSEKKYSNQYKGIRRVLWVNLLYSIITLTSTMNVVLFYCPMPWMNTHTKKEQGIQNMNFHYPPDICKYIYLMIHFSHFSSL